MAAQIEIIQDELNKVQFTFYFDDYRYTLFLNKYLVFKRETKRHGWKCVSFYDRLNDRNSKIKESEVPLTEEIKQQALNEFFKIITVKKWSER